MTRLEALRKAFEDDGETLENLAAVTGCAPSDLEGAADEVRSDSFKAGQTAAKAFGGSYLRRQAVKDHAGDLQFWLGVAAGAAEMHGGR